MRTIGYGVIGLGFFGEKHAEVAASLPNVELPHSTHGARCPTP